MCACQNRPATSFGSLPICSTERWAGWTPTEIRSRRSFSYSELVTKAGVSRGCIRAAIDEAVAGGYIVCLQPGQRKSQGQSGQTASYQLRWNADGGYSTDRSTFCGFYAGEGHRTPIPNGFFRRVVRRERLSVVKVVGTVLRHTIGYQNQFGGRRSVAPLSYNYMLRYSSLRDRSSLSEAIGTAIDSGYIRQVSPGVVDPNPGVRQPATYAVHWRTAAGIETNGSKIRPARRDPFENPTSNGSKTRPADQSGNPTKGKTTEKDTYKQQTVNAVVKENNNKAIVLLTDAGFDEVTAMRLCEGRGVDEIRNQIDWLALRNPDSNPLGLLRMAIEQNWLEPPAAVDQRRKKERAESERQLDQETEQQEMETTTRKQARRSRRQTLLPAWQELSGPEQTAIEQDALRRLRSDFDRQRFRENENYRRNLSLDEFGRRSAKKLSAVPS